MTDLIYRVDMKFNVGPLNSDLVEPGRHAMAVTWFIRMWVDGIGSKYNSMVIRRRRVGCAGPSGPPAF